MNYCAKAGRPLLFTFWQAQEHNHAHPVITCIRVFKNTFLNQFRPIEALFGHIAFIMLLSGDAFYFLISPSIPHTTYRFFLNYILHRRKHNFQVCLDHLWT